MDPYRATFGIDELIRVAPTAGIAATNPKDGVAPSLQGSNGVGALGAGTYICNINTQGLNAITVHLKPNAQNAGGTPTLQAVMLDKVTPRTAPAAVVGAAFVAGTLQTLTMTGLAGCQTVQLTWTVTTSIDFSGATGIAQVVGL